MKPPMKGIEMDLDYLVTTIDRTISTTTQEFNEIANTPDDRIKVVALLQIVGELQGELVFLKGQMTVTPKKSRNPFKR